MRLGDASRMKVETICTGALTLDLALGGGLPKGRVIENLWSRKFGKKQQLRCMRSPKYKKAGGIAAFVDAEHALDPTYASALGVDYRKFTSISA